MKNGLNLWDTATVVSTKFTPQLAEVYENSVEKMALSSIDRMGIDYIDMYWIHNPMDVERWTPGLIPLLQSGKVKRVGVSNHNIAAESDRGKKYNPVLSQLEALTNEMTTIGQKYGASCSQIGIAWAIAKGTMPIIGATKDRHVVEAAEAAKIQLTADEVARLERLADATGIDTRGGWEHSME